MVDEPLLNALRQLEVELHQPTTRSDPARMARLLHPEFEEFGRSGRLYTRQDVLKEFSAADRVFPSIAAEAFEVRRLSESVALLTYVSAHRDESGKTHRHTRRSSVWVKSPDAWQIRFHQGTPIPDAVKPSVD